MKTTIHKLGHLLSPLTKCRASNIEHTLRNDRFHRQDTLELFQLKCTIHTQNAICSANRIWQNIKEQCNLIGCALWSEIELK